MRARLILASLVVVAGTSVFAGTLLATPPSKVTPTEYGVGEFQSFAVTGKIGAWRAAMKIIGASDMHVLSNRIAPGGSFGWHRHPGPSFVIIKSGTATVYFGADPTVPAPQVSGRKGIRRQGPPGPCGAKRRQSGPRDRRGLVHSSGRNEANGRAEPRQLPVLGRQVGWDSTAHPRGTETVRLPRKVQMF